jgi:hypothetical protein
MNRRSLDHLIEEALEAIPAIWMQFDALFLWKPSV